MTAWASAGGHPMSVEMLTYAALGERLGCSTEAARSFAKRMSLPRSRANDGKTLVGVDLAEISHKAMPPRSPSAASPAAMRARLDELQSELQAAYEEIRRHRSDFESERARVDKLMAETLRLTGEIMAAREVTARREAELAGVNVEIAEMRADRDRWCQLVQDRLAVIGPSPDSHLPGNRWQRAWRWMRATGCFATAGLLLAFATVDAGAQQEQAPAQECFTVMMNMTGSAGSILFNRCTGNSWLLARTAIPGGYALRWHPIRVDESESSLFVQPTQPARPAR
jgi:hypothetical protein